MKVLTLNVWGAYGPPERRAVLREAIMRIDAHILLLQEANVPGLLESLPYPTRVHAPETGLAILSRYTLLEERRVNYSALSQMEKLLRGALFARLDVGGTPVWTGTTHLAWKADDGATRLAQVRELLTFAASMEDPALMGGDFNAPPEDPPLQRMVSSGFTDVYAGIAAGEPGITWDNKNPFIQAHSVQFPDRRIDYLFLRDKSAAWLRAAGCEVTCKTAGAGGLHPSDHYGVLAAFQR